MNALGWFFCEISFRGFEALGNGAYRDGDPTRPKWWAWPLDRLLSAAHRAGTFFYRRAA